MIRLAVPIILLLLMLLGGGARLFSDSLETLEATRKPAALTGEIIAKFQPWLRKGMKRT